MRSPTPPAPIGPPAGGGLEGSKEPELKQVAQAGGGQACFLGGSQNVQQDLLAKLGEIAAASLACDFQIPEERTGGKVDPSLMNVRIFPAMGQEREPYEVGGQPDCTGDGWLYDDENDPKRISLCEEACDAVRADPQAHIELLLGC